jgi:DNA-binding response OmpR family regulator
MEPNILLIGRNLDTLEILKDELIKFNRNIVYANSEEQITSYLTNKKIDLIIVGAGLPTETRDELVVVIEKSAPEIELHIMQRTPGITPVSMVNHTNDKAIMWRLLNIRKNK